MHRYFIRKFISLDLGCSIYTPECISLKNWNCEKPCRQSWYNENYIVFFLKFLKLFKCKWECSGCRLWDTIVKYVGTENYHQVMLIVFGWIEILFQSFSNWCYIVLSNNHDDDGSSDQDDEESTSRVWFLYLLTINLIFVFSSGPFTNTNEKWLTLVFFFSQITSILFRVCQNLAFIFIFACVCSETCCASAHEYMCVHLHVCGCVYRWKSEDNLEFWSLHLTLFDTGSHAVYHCIYQVSWPVSSQEFSYFFCRSVGVIDMW